ncbi:MAG: efflux RND transporter permease subunit, partial [Deltaproteobacteria bacterium]|nr:efflux RND transporter permease subunit [Deltaproteobacteria bacterium]
LAFIGAVFGVLISGNPFSLVTLFGFVALAGVAVNDAIVLVSFINNLRAEGMNTKEAVVQAGRLRLRPIMLTSITTIAGLTPWPSAWEVCPSPGRPSPTPSGPGLGHCTHHLPGSGRLRHFRRRYRRTALPSFQSDSEPEKRVIAISHEKKA